MRWLQDPDLAVKFRIHIMYRSVADPDPGSGIRCFFYPRDPDPGSGMEQWSDPDPGSGIRDK
jgi:hypothetical protein